MGDDEDYDEDWALRGASWMLDAENETHFKLIVEDGDDWRLYALKDPGYRPLYRAYHRHEEGWVCQLTMFPVCAKCRAKAPEAMEGFEKLIRWKM